MRTSISLSLSTCAMAVLLVACGGSNDTATTTAASTSGTTTTTGTTPTSTTATVISGSAIKGPVSGATVTVKKASDGTVLGTTTTGAGGVYTLSVSYTGDVIVEVSGGSYTDEATNATTPLSTPMKTVIAANGSSVTGVVTPLTTMAFTSAFPNGSGATATAFKNAADKLATQFQLNGVDITTTTPVVTGTTNAYGKALIGVSKYLQQNSTTLETITNKTLTSADWSSFSGKYSAAYNAANGTQVTYSINGGTITTSVTGTTGGTVTTTVDQNGATVSGTGAGGGSGTCGITVQGSMSAAGFTVPINMSFCAKGMTGSCDSGNSSLSQIVSGQQGLTGAANLQYSYSASCPAGAYPITIQ